MAITAFIADVWNGIVAAGRWAGLWRIDAWAWNRRARQFDDLATTAPAVTPDGAARLRQQAQRYRDAAADARPARR